MADDNTKKLNDLRKQQDELAKKIQDQEKLAKAEVRTQIMDILKGNGYTLSDLFDVTITKTRRVPTGTRYVNPDNSDLSWSGRGRAPDWLKKKIDEGATLEDFKS